MSFIEYLLIFYFRLLSILKKILLVVLITLFFTVSIVFAIGKVSKEKYNLYAIESESMLPVFNVGTLVVTEKRESYNMDDIVTFQYKNHMKTITHRVIEIKNQTITTKGDNNPIPDPQKISVNEIKGKVIYSFPMIGYFVLFLNSTTGIIILFIIPVSILLTLNIVDIYKWFKDKVESIKKRYSI